MQIGIRIGDQRFTATLDDSPASRGMVKSAMGRGRPALPARWAAVPWLPVLPRNDAARSPI